MIKNKKAEEKFVLESGEKIEVEYDNLRWLKLNYWCTAKLVVTSGFIHIIPTEKKSHLRKKKHRKLLHLHSNEESNNINDENDDFVYKFSSQKFSHIFINKIEKKSLGKKKKFKK